MGRVSRHKKIKAFDPFSKTRGVVPEDPKKKYDMAPTMKDLHASSTSSRNNFSFKKKPVEKKYEKKLNHLGAFPGESLKAYNRRVNRELIKAKQTLNTELKPLNKISEKRKEYLDRKKGKQLVTADDSDDEVAPSNTAGLNSAVPEPESVFGSSIEDMFPRLQQYGKIGVHNVAKENDDFRKVDVVRFGERVEAPPVFKSIPRNATDNKLTVNGKKSRNKYANLLAAAPLLAVEKEEERKRNLPSSSSQVSKKPKLSRDKALYEARMEQARNEAIASYKKMKQNKRPEPTVSM